jgi:triose/dihydroxyacetone kinase / FAD-AMP lyase (cyclizing)
MPTFITAQDVSVSQSIDGFTFMNPSIESSNRSTIFSKTSREIATNRKDMRGIRCQVVTGGGSGHEPAFAGFVGARNAIDCCVIGELFSSPSVEQILRALACMIGAGEEEEENEKRSQVGGIFMLIMNYTGDVVNFSIARDRAKKELGIENIEVFAFDDDCSIPIEERGRGGARGLCGTLLALKAVTAAANLPKIASAKKDGAFWSNNNNNNNKSTTFRTVEELRIVAEKFRKETKTFGFSLNRCDVPGKQQDASLIVPDGKVELGLGIHNESGFKTVDFESLEKTVAIAMETIERELMLEQRVQMRTSNGIFAKIDEVFGLSPSKKMEIGLVKPLKLCLVVNGLGGTSNFELNVIANCAQKWIKDRSNNYEVTHAMCGSFMTSLNMHGASISLCCLDEDNNGSGEEFSMADLLDTPCDCPAWPRCINLSNASVRVVDENIERTATSKLVLAPPSPTPAIEEGEEGKEKEQKDLHASIKPPSKKEITKKEPKITVTAIEAETLAAAIQLSCATILSMKDELTRLDAIAGDGDCGDTLAAGAQAILEDSVDYRYAHPDLVCEQLANSCARSMGGTSGVLYDVFFRACGDVLKDAVDENDYDANEFEYRDALARGITAIREHGKANIGDRTMLDALMPALGRWGMLMNDDLRLQCDRIAKAAKDGAEETRQMQANAGRAAYVNKYRLKEMNVPDPGALACAAWIGASCEEVTKLMAKRSYSSF